MRMDLPKGMEPIKEEAEEPKHISLMDGNYVAAIYQALDLLPVIIRIEKCIVVEQDGAMPEVNMTLVIEGEKQGGDEHGDNGVLPAEQGVRGKR